MDPADLPLPLPTGLPTGAAPAPVRPAGDDLLDLRRRVDRLVLINAALWELLKARTGAEDIDLTAALVEIEAQAAADRSCRGCGRRLQAKSQTCQYCGRNNPPSSPILGL
jgi:hypothetical protein